MRKFLLLILTGIAVLSAQFVTAQVQTVTGRVTDASTNVSLPGTTVVIKGTTTGVICDSKGDYSIRVSRGQVLVFSSIGYDKKEVNVGSSAVINVGLAVSANLVSEVVVVGYGTQRKENLTGAVASVDTKLLEARPIPDIGRGLQGTTPGLTVVIPSGEVGSDPILRVRGWFGSFQGSANPLILLDNVEIPSIQLINPDDVESISILKDAASSSIYGSKAAFGVILITSKKGAKTEKVNVSYSFNNSFQNISKKMEMGRLDALEYTLSAFERVGGTVAGAFWYVTREGYNKAKTWQQQWGNIVKPNDPMVYGRDWYVDANGRKIGLRTYDPYDYMIREWKPTQTHNLSVNGRTGKTDYNISAAYLDQAGLMKPSKRDDFQRYNGSVRIGTDVNKWLRVTAGALYSKRIKHYGYATNSTTADPWLYLYRWAPIYPMTTEDGDPIRSPAFELGAANTAYQETGYTSFNGGLKISPLKAWKINFDYTYANQQYTTKRPGTRFTARDSWVSAIPKNDASGARIYMDSTGTVVPSTAKGAMAAYQLPMSQYTAAGGNPDHIYEEAMNSQWTTINLTTTYDLALLEAHKLNFMLGLNRVTYKWTDNWSQITQLTDYTNPQFNLATGTQTAGGTENWDSQLGVFGRINYNYKEKYLLEANLRYDGTSKFPTRLQWRWYPSFSAGWRVNEESFMQWAKPTLSALKLRASWGSIGDQSVANLLYIPTMAGSFNNWIISNAKIYQFSTPPAVSFAVTWQDITTLDFGLDTRFLKGDFGISFDWYRRATNNMLVPQEGLPLTYGVGAPQGNFGSARTDGIELQLDYNHRFRNGLGINLTATFSDSKTIITKYGTAKGVNNNYVGKTFGEIWGYETDRLYQQSDFLYDASGKLIPVTSKDGFTVNQLSDANGATQGKLQSGNFKFGPGDVKFKDLNGDGIITPGNQLIQDVNGKPDYGDLKVIGNSTPRYQYGFRGGADFKGFDVSFFLQGVGKRSVWGEGFLAIPGYNSADGAMPEAIASNFWRPDRTDAFYPAPYNLAGGNGILNMQVQTRYLLNMAYLRIKNITVGYSLPVSWLQKAMINKLRIYIALENFVTFDHLGTLPIDPEEIEGYSMWNSSNYNLGRTGMGVPTYKSASFGVQLNF